MSSSNSSLPVSVRLPVTLPSLGCQSSGQSVTASNVYSQKHLWNESLPLEENFLILSQLFSEIMQEKYAIKMSSDFLKIAAAAMVHLQDCNRANIIDLLARALGSMRADGSDSLLPARRVPTGLIKHTTNFFNAEHVNEVR